MNDPKVNNIAKIAIVEDAHKDLAQIVTIVSALAHANNIEKKIRIFPILLSSAKRRAVDAEFNKIKKDVEDESIMSLHQPVEIIENTAEPNLDGIIDALDKSNPDLIISDVFMGEANAGLKLLEKISERGKTELWQCWVMTQNPESTEAILAFPETSTFDPKENYLKKSELLNTKISDCLNINQNEGDRFKYAKKLSNALKEAVNHVSVRGNDRLGEIVSISPLMNGKKGVFEMIIKFAAVNSTVLILGENGTGKGLVARELLANSTRAEKPFVIINSAAIPKDLLESELFGHRKGSFTNATFDKVGLFEVAHKGTLFLDEIGDLDTSLQGKVLTAVQDKIIRRIGEVGDINVDVRVIAATNKDLFKMKRKGMFREDLYYRLNVLTIKIPPLRKRRCDIPLLMNHFIKKFTNSSNRKISINRKAKQVLENYSYPGNIRELESAIERAILLCDKDEITVEDLPPEMVNDLTSSTPVDLNNGITTDDIDFDGVNNEEAIWKKMKEKEGELKLDLTDKGKYWKENSKKCYDIMVLAAKDFNNHLSDAESTLFFNIDIRALRNKTKTKNYDLSILTSRKRKP